ncbi:hypothetical protein ATO6_01690 [Oceanicola sp. 22II-s10i]|uniref:caspase family protein n=1 Tax=Oceanicola sp. 22II-s10i TaxID=1317116 RepID=UPI000B658DF9|nr:caspase family protein [Oceanicola sp. 22II-s10i]OWU86711.1 hypothetical protein ATO6_01690 [Oceanicola sp. 22II-s10i]
MNRRLRLVLPVVAALLSVMPAVAQDTPDFRLELDTGGHRAVIRALSADAEGRRIASVSDDKTVRIWDLSGASAPSVLRGFMGDGNDGLVNAVALSSDGSRVAVAGYFGPHNAAQGPFGDIRIFDTGTRAVTGVLKGYPLIVDSLSYSAERDELAVGGQGGVIHRWRAPFSDAPEQLAPLDSYASRVLRVAFAAGGTRVVAVTTDYGLRMWTAEGDEIEPPEAEPLWDVVLTGLAISADGSRFALSGADGRVEVRAAEDGAVLTRLPDRPFRPDALAFDAEGRLIVGCTYLCAGAHGAEVWDLSGPTRTADYAGHKGAISAALALPNGSVLTAGGAAPAIHLWRPGTGQASRVLAGEGAPVTAVGIAPDASRIAWGTGDPCPDRPVCPEVPGTLTASLELPNGDRGFGKPESTVPGGLDRAVLSEGDTALSVTDAPGGVFAGDVLRIEGPDGAASIRKGPTDGYYHSAATLLPDMEEALSGGANGLLIAHDLTGTVAGEYVGHTGDILALAAAEGANRLISGSADQTMVLWNLETREEIARFFFAGEDWIIWTPQGYFHSSPEGDRLVGWRVNRGRDEAARYIRARELKRHLHSPEIVRRAILTGDPAAAARDLRGTDSELTDLLMRAPPDFDLRIAEEIDAPDGIAVIELTGARADEVEDWGYTILVNDRRVPPVPYADPTGQGRSLYQVPLGPGENAIRVTGEDDFGYITERGAVALNALRTAAPEKRGKLYVAVIGVADYPNLPDACNGRSCDLAYPVNDAVEILATLARTTAPLYEAMETLVIVSPSRIDGSDSLMTTLSAVTPADAILPPEGRVVEDELIDFLARPTEEDTTIVFVAGHGLNIDEDYFLVPGDARRRGEEWRRSSLFDWRILQDEMGYALGRRILLIDTCHAQGAFNARLEKDAADARIAVFSATAANNTAAERRDLGHGIFTYALLEGLRGKAATGDDGVRLLGLADYVYREVIRLSDQRQEPFYSLLDTSNYVVSRP